jgi:cell division protein FtsB
MNVITFATERIRAAHQRKILARKLEFIVTVEDQVSSGRALLDRLYRERDQLQAELHLLDDADTILRRAGAI